MGPRHEGRGRLGEGGRGRGRGVVQWGRATRGGEDFVPETEPLSRRTWLQWGHATRGVEDAPSATRTSPRPSSFNGATPRGAWKTSAGGGAWAARRGFNGATPRGAWKTP